MLSVRGSTVFTDGEGVQSMRIVAVRVLNKLPGTSDKEAIHYLLCCLRR